MPGRRHILTMSSKVLVLSSVLPAWSSCQYDCLGFIVGLVTDRKGIWLVNLLLSPEPAWSPKEGCYYKKDNKLEAACRVVDMMEECV